MKIDVEEDLIDKEEINSNVIDDEMDGFLENNEGQGKI